MRVTVEDANHSISEHYPPNLINFRLGNDRSFYDNDDYIYSFREGGERRTLPTPLGFRPSEEQLSRQTFLQFKGLFFRKIERPPARLTRLVEKIFATGLLNPDGDLNGAVWPIELVDKRELHVIKSSSSTHDEVEAVILQLIGEYLGLSKDEVEPDFSPTGNTFNTRALRVEQKLHVSGRGLLL